MLVQATCASKLRVQQLKKQQSLLPEDGVTLLNVVNNKIVLFLSICCRC
jgi:hypothetical protein